MLVTKQWTVVAPHVVSGGTKPPVVAIPLSTRSDIYYRVEQLHTIVNVNTGGERSEFE